MQNTIRVTKIKRECHPIRLMNLTCLTGPVYNEDGDIVISEEEFMEIQKLKDLKTSYRTDFEELKTLRTQVQYCQKLVDQCRQRLLNGKLRYGISVERACLNATSYNKHFWNTKK